MQSIIKYYIIIKLTSNNSSHITNIYNTSNSIKIISQSSLNKIIINTSKTITTNRIYSHRVHHKAEQKKKTYKRVEKRAIKSYKKFILFTLFHPHNIRSRRSKRFHAPNKKTQEK